MISKSWSRKSIATAVAVAVLSVYSMVVLAAPGAKASGELSVSGQVTVNGEKAVSVVGRPLAPRPKPRSACSSSVCSSRRASPRGCEAGGRSKLAGAGKPPADGD